MPSAWFHPYYDASSLGLNGFRDGPKRKLMLTKQFSRPISVSSTRQVGRWFEARRFNNFADAEAGQRCEVSGLYYPGHALIRTEHMGNVGVDFYRKEPCEDDYTEYQGEQF